MNDRWNKNNTSVFRLTYHIIWCAKYRMKVLFYPIDVSLKKIVCDILNENDCVLIKQETMADHIHLLVETKPTTTLSLLMKKLKGVSSRVLREKFPHLLKFGQNLWSRSYFCETVGFNNKKRVENYIKNQRYA